MSKKDMLRSTWTRVTAKKQIIRELARDGRQGKVSLLKILDINGPLIRNYDNREIVLADVGYYWLQLAFDGEYAWYTVMYNVQKELVQLYVDVTDGNSALCENPIFEDMYLDYVMFEGKVYELDRDELEDAFSEGKITKEQFEKALAEGARIEAELRRDPEGIMRSFRELFERLLPEIEADIIGGIMKFKEGEGWKACYDETSGICTAERSGSGYYDLYEITRETFDLLEDGMSDHDTYQSICEGRHLYMDVNDRCGPPYTIVFDDDYEKLCPWAKVKATGRVWPDELTDAAVELFESEKNNREQRRRKREEREKK